MNQTFDAIGMAVMVPMISDVIFAVEDLKDSITTSMNLLEGIINTKNFK